MTILENTMAEVLLSDKDIIEKITKEKDEILEKYVVLQSKQNKIEHILESLGVEDNFDEFINFISFLYNNKNEFLEFLNIKKNNKEINNNNIEEDKKYISLKNKNKEMQEQIKELNIKLSNLSNNENKNIYPSVDDEIKKALSNQRKDFDEKVENINKAHKEEIDSIKIRYENTNQNIPTPSSSTEKINKNDELKNILPLPNNINEVVYYRHTKNNYSYFKIEGKKYLRCCGTDYSFKEISNNNFITCLKCYKTYNLSKKVNENNIHKILVKTLKEHIISNEDEILLKIKCNRCNNIYKKEINLCNSCKYVYNCIPIVTEIPNDDVGINTVKTFASETFTKINFNSNIYDIAQKEGINVYEMRLLVKFIKENNLLKEKQPNIIIKKILRCRYIFDIYNEYKYKSIQDIIKRIYINLDYIPKLDDSQFSSFKNILIKILDSELEKYNKNIEINKESKENIDYEDDNIILNNKNNNRKKCAKIPIMIVIIM